MDMLRRQGKPRPFRFVEDGPVYDSDNSLALPSEAMRVRNATVSEGVKSPEGGDQQQREKKRSSSAGEEVEKKKEVLGEEEVAPRGLNGVDEVSALCGEVLGEDLGEDLGETTAGGSGVIGRRKMGIVVPR